jgi:hypothetical protein
MKLVWTIQSGAEMEISHHHDGTVNKMQRTLFVKRRPNRILKTLLESWHTQEEGIKMKLYLII